MPLEREADRQMENDKLTFEFYDQATANRRLAELVLYISMRSMDDPDFGKTKLNKILLKSDFYGYLKLGKAVTGSRYMRLDHGPVPQQMHPVCEQLKYSGDLDYQRINRYGKIQLRPIALREPKLSDFSGEEIAMVDSIIDELRGKNATQVSDATHGRVWGALKNKELIPYQAAYVSDAPVTERDRDIARKLAAEHGWGDYLPNAGV